MNIFRKIRIWWIKRSLVNDFIKCGIDRTTAFKEVEKLMNMTEKDMKEFNKIHE